MAAVVAADLRQKRCKQHTTARAQHHAAKMSAQDVVDASEHYDVYNTEDIPSLLTIIIDTNPRAWAALTNVLPLSKAMANIIIFVNAHLAFNNSNQVALIASHCNRAMWLYPSPPSAASSLPEDVEMRDAGPGGPKAHQPLSLSANKHPQYAQIETALLNSLRNLIDDTTAADVSSTTTSQISGALSLALGHIQKTALSFTADSALGAGPPAAGTLAGLHARILVISVSDSSASQYIPTMNSIFAAAHAHIAIDTLCLRGSATFLEQASFITRGTFVRAKEPQGLLQYLMLGFSSGSIPSLPSGAAEHGKKGQAGKGPKTGAKADKIGGRQLDQGASVAKLLVTPTADSVDFRAACFCHRKVVDMGFVCSVCLCIFCDVPEDGSCLTCGTKLALRNYGARPVVSPNAKRKATKANGEV